LCNSEEEAKASAERILQIYLEIEQSSTKTIIIAEDTESKQLLGTAAVFFEKKFFRNLGLVA